MCTKCRGSPTYENVVPAAYKIFWIYSMGPQVNVGGLNYVPVWFVADFVLVFKSCQPWTVFHFSVTCGNLALNERNEEQVLEQRAAFETIGGSSQVAHQLPPGVVPWWLWMTAYSNDLEVIITIRHLTKGKVKMECWLIPRTAHSFLEETSFQSSHIRTS